MPIRASRGIWPLSGTTMSVAGEPKCVHRALRVVGLLPVLESERGLGGSRLQMFLLRGMYGRRGTRGFPAIVRCPLKRKRTCFTICTVPKPGEKKREGRENPWEKSEIGWFAETSLVFSMLRRCLLSLCGPMQQQQRSSLVEALRRAPSCATTVSALFRSDTDRSTSAFFVEAGAFPVVTASISHLEDDAALLSALKMSTNFLLHGIESEGRVQVQDDAFPNAVCRVVRRDLTKVHIVKAGMHALFHYLLHHGQPGSKGLTAFVEESAGDHVVRQILEHYAEHPRDYEIEVAEDVVDFAIAILCLCLNMESVSEEKAIQAVPVVVGAMTAYGSSPAVQHKGWVCLQACTTLGLNPTNAVQRELRNAGRINTVLSSLVAHGKSSFPQMDALYSSAAMTLTGLTGGGRGGTTISAEEKDREEVARSVLLSNVTDAMLVRLRDPNASEMCRFHILCFMVDASASDPALTTDNGVVTILDIVRKSESPSVVERSLNVLWNILNRREALPALKLHDARGAVVEVMKRITSESDKQMCEKILEKIDAVITK